MDGTALAVRCTAWWHAVRWAVGIVQQRSARLAGRTVRATPCTAATAGAVLAICCASHVAWAAGAETEDGAADVRDTLSRIHLPPGYRIALYAMVPGARHLAVAPHSDTVVVGTRGHSVWRVERVGDVGRAARYAPSVSFDLPNGVCWTRAGDLIVAEFDAIRRFDGAERVGAVAPPARDVVPAGRLVPDVVTSHGHGARVCRVGPDGKLYVAIGQPHNVPPKSRLALYERAGVGGIVRMDARDGSAREVYARGIRNSVGLDFNPADGTLWFTDNQTDGMGDDTPPGEIDRATAPGQHFGYPYLGGRSVRIPDYASDPLPAGLVPPQVEMAAHAADLGLVFYTGTAFPADTRGAIFSAQHGSWNRTVPIGARVMLTRLKPDGTAAGTEVFASGWLDASGRYLGQPVDVAVLHDGSLLVSDDLAGALYRVTYDAAKVGAEPSPAASTDSADGADSPAIRQQRRRPGATR